MEIAPHAPPGEFRRASVIAVEEKGAPGGVLVFGSRFAGALFASA